MERYSVIPQKHPREIVLLKGAPCAWGKCTFCDYIDDNSRNKKRAVELNHQVLSQVQGLTGTLEVINSGSCFELPEETLFMIQQLLAQKKINRLFLESHWMYRHRLQEMRDRMGVPIIFKIGVETFDYDFREKVLNKHAPFHAPEEVAAYFDSPCLMVGILGQTKAMIERDMQILQTNFSMGTVNIFTENTTSMKRDSALIDWFGKRYAFLNEDPRIEILYENTDFGVG
ncbi:MAG TPA: radical SAM protein [Ruminococcaceae bacterium]|nr:radical SAM protein [Oscillospiraceae bacterium]